MRFNLIFNLIVIVLAIMPFIAPQEVIFGVIYWFTFLWVLITSLYLNTLRKLKNHKKVTDHSQCCDFINVMMTFIYKEPIKILEETLTILKLLNHCERLHVYVGFEERTPGVNEKVQMIMEKFQGSFARLVCTIHPYGVEGEIPGKCSNSNYVLRQIHKDFASSQLSYPDQ